MSERAERRRAYNRARESEFRRRLTDMKRAAGCVSCGRRHGRLEYHHIDPSTKRFTVGEHGTRSWATILAEVAKCEVRCPSCHQRHHLDEDPHRNVRAGRAGGAAGRGKPRPWQTPEWYAKRRAGLL